MKKLSNLNRVWDLDVFFPGGPDSPQLLTFLDALERDISDFHSVAQTAPQGAAEWAARLDALQKLSIRAGQAGAFISCHSAADVYNLAASFLSGRIGQIGAQMEVIDLTVSNQLLALDDCECDSLLASPELEELAFNLRERRERAKKLMSAEKEAVASALSVNGYHGWNDLYNHVTAGMNIKIREGWKAKIISPGQLENRLHDPDAKKRAYYMDKWDAAWDSVADTVAVGLNQLAGYRLSLYKARGWDDFLYEPMTINRMQRKTLDSMYSAITQNLPRLTSFIERKKKLLGLSSFGWQDIGAPGGESTAKLTYDEAANFIVENFAKMAPNMAQLAVRAFEENWIESEDRPGKRMGGFCSSFPEAKQSRIFVTFSGSADNMATLAHELGHAYHGWVLRDLPPMTRRYAMNVAETASTFAEVLVGDAAIAAAKTREERLGLIEGKLKRTVMQLSNLVCRFTFECAFYNERSKGEVSVQRLNELMVDAQKTAYGNSLDRWHPTFWASKLHFHITRVPFYNFPYTFGYLFATGIYAQAVKAGQGFEQKYAALLMDTGRSTVEDLASKHLGVDITEPGFWLEAIDLAYAELDEWLEATR